MYQSFGLPCARSAKKLNATKLSVPAQNLPHWRSYTYHMQNLVGATYLKRLFRSETFRNITLKVCLLREMCVLDKGRLKVSLT